jgi:hypothetical protein
MFQSAAGRLLVVLFVAISGTRATAAELRPDPSRPTGSGMVFEGTIETGDFERFKKFILDSGHTAEIYLASPGGNLSEAVKIGILLRLLKLSTVVPSKALTHYDRVLAVTRHGLKASKDYTCASACFFIFVAGIHRSADGHGPAILGIHSPTLAPTGLAKVAPDQINTATDRTRKFIESYFKIMDVPAKYIEEIYSVPKNRIRWIRNDEFESDFAGFIPDLKALVRAKCGNRSDQVGQDNAEHDCASEIRDELAVRALKDALKGQSSDSPQSIFKMLPQSRPN